MSNYPLRLPKNLLEDARELAKSEGVSMNAFLSAIVAERVGEKKVLAQLQARAARADAARALAVLDQAPERTPMAGDEVLL
jgi:hypothetical protein